MTIEKKKKSKLYFTQDTEDAIILFNNTEDLEEREIIYRNHIHQPFDKLAENIINRFKFPYMDSSFRSIKDQVVSFLVLNIHKYEKSKGKAFSYFSVIAKHYLILNNNSGYKHEKRSIYWSDSADNQPALEEIIIIDNELEETKKDMKEFSLLMLEFWDNNLVLIFKKNRDIRIADSILELFRKADGIENFNKKALYLLVREMTGYKTSSITKVVNKMSEYMNRHLQEFRDTGTITNHSKYFTYPK